MSIANLRKTHCKRGHPLIGENVYSRPGTAWRDCQECRRMRVAARKKPKAPRADEFRFFSHVTVSASGCWEFDSLDSSGYGSFWALGRNLLAHRWSFEFIVGPIPKGLHLDHLCRNPPCVNPSHLEPVTARENTLRGISPIAGNLLKQSCPSGHPYSGENLRITPSGRRVCRACHRRNSKASRLRKGAKR